MSNAKTARFGPGANWDDEGYYYWQRNMTEVMKKKMMDCSPVSARYTDDGKYCWSWHQTSSYSLGYNLFYDLGAGDDLPKPLLAVANDRALGSFVGIGAVAACKVAAADAVNYCLGKGGVSRHKLGRSLKQICKEVAYWGAAVGAFETFEFRAELMRGRSDWKNAMIGGALAGATVSAAASYNSHGGNVDTRHQVIKAAIAGGAIGTAFEFISQRRHVDRFDQGISPIS